MKNNRLDEIIAEKKKEVAKLQQMLKENPHHPINQILMGGTTVKPTHKFKNALKGEKLSVIAEIKRASPSKGIISSSLDPAQLALQYRDAKANAISVLTDTNFFKGSLEDFRIVLEALKECPLPILRKEFIIDRGQIAQSVSEGADAILLIVAALGNKTKQLLDETNALGIDAIVEVCNMEELEIALKADAQIIGINNRDLQTFETDINNAFKLFDKIPKDKIKIAESGILDPGTASEYHKMGYDAVLIGEALVKSENPALFIKACRDES